MTTELLRSERHDEEDSFRKETTASIVKYSVRAGGTFCPAAIIMLLPPEAHRKVFQFTVVVLGTVLGFAHLRG
jgi:hypothetical protein